jgi:hypothetical protein
MPSSLNLGIIPFCLGKKIGELRGRLQRHFALRP